MGIKSLVRDNVVVAGVQALASANTLQLPPTINSNDVFRITGNTTIKTISLPVDDPYFIGPVFLYNTDSSVGTWDTTGNIALAGTLTRYKVIGFVFDVVANKWYPTAVS